MRSLFYGLLIAVSAGPAFADVPPVQAVRTDRPVLVDGLLDEEIWKNGSAVANFHPLGTCMLALNITSSVRAPAGYSSNWFHE